MRIQLRLLPVLISLLLAFSAEARVKNIIVMIADGAGFDTLQAVRLYTGKPLAMDGKGWVRLAQSTYPLRRERQAPPGHALEQDPAMVYDSAAAWDTTPVPGPSRVKGFESYPAGFAGYEWSRATYPDSANTMSAMMTGQKSYNNAINVDGAGAPLTTLAETAHAAGRGVGVVTTVQFSDATPAAAAGAHNIARANAQAIAAEMFARGLVSVIAGSGDPESFGDGACNFRAAGKDASAFEWISPELWSALKTGSAKTGSGQPWTLVRDRATVQALADGQNAAPPDHLAIIAPAFNAMQFCRPDGSADQFGAHYETYRPYDTPRLDTLPSLPELSLAALQSLRRNPAGFFLMIEGGAIDRAMHANNFGRMVEEYIEFNDTVEKIIAWIGGRDGPGWADTLLIVTADHDHNLYGPDGATVPFQPLIDRGPGHVPGYAWFGMSHSNNLVPIFAFGAQADQVGALASRLDFHVDAQGRRFGRGRYLDQTDLGRFLLQQAR